MKGRETDLAAAPGNQGMQRIISRLFSAAFRERVVSAVVDGKGIVAVKLEGRQESGVGSVPGGNHRYAPNFCRRPTCNR